jgi:hypothetical protein
MRSIDFTMLSDRFILGLESLVLPYIRVSQHGRRALFQEFSRFLSIEASITFELVFESAGVVLRKLTCQSVQYDGLTMMGSKSAGRELRILLKAASRPRLL